jgi:hypothetical protein
MKLYGVQVTCNKGCKHLISADKDYINAWAKAPVKYAGLESATTIRIGANAKVVRVLRNKNE